MWFYQGTCDHQDHHKLLLFFNDDIDFDAKCVLFLSLMLVILQWFITVSEF